MNKTITILLIAISFKTFGQNFLAEVSVSDSKIQLDTSLTECDDYLIKDNNDSLLIRKKYYKGGLLQTVQELNHSNGKNWLTSYEYSTNNLLQKVTSTVNDTNGEQFTKSTTEYLYDQYNNVYFTRTEDNRSNRNVMYLIDEFFTNYIYQDSLILYANVVHDSRFFGFDQFHSKNAYNDKRQLVKIYVKNQGQTEYKLRKDFFYDELGNNVKTIMYCFDDSNCKNDSLTYKYNPKKQIIEESHVTHISWPTEVVQKDIIFYNYDQFGRIISISKTKEQLHKIRVNSYYVYK